MFYPIMSIIGLLIFVPIGIAYYYDYKSNPKEFHFSRKKVTSKILQFTTIMLVVFLLSNLWEYAVPFHQKHVVEFNAERKSKNIPPLDKDWNLEKHTSSQFTKVYINPKIKEKHFKKVIQYNYSDIISETDYYKNGLNSGNFVWSTYDFENNTFKYFSEKPAEQIVSVNESGRFYYNDPTKTMQISEPHFKCFIKN